MCYFILRSVLLHFFQKRTFSFIKHPSVVCDSVVVLNVCRDKVVSRFERCCAQFSDASNLWLAAESSVQLHGQTVGNFMPSISAVESGFGASASYHSSSLSRSSRLPKAATADQDTAICASAEATDEKAEIVEPPGVRLERLKRLKEHLVKFFQRFNTHEILTLHQCTCEAQKW